MAIILKILRFERFMKFASTSCVFYCRDDRLDDCVNVVGLMVRLPME